MPWYMQEWLRSIRSHRNSQKECQRLAMPAKSSGAGQQPAGSSCSHGKVLGTHDYDFSGAEREFKRALELNPNLPIAHSRYAGLLSQLGRLMPQTQNFAGPLTSNLIRLFSTRVTAVHLRQLADMMTRSNNSIGRLNWIRIFFWHTALLAKPMNLQAIMRSV